MPQPQLSTLDHFVLTVASIPDTLAFYEDILGMRRDFFTTAQGEQRWALLFGQMKINLHEAGREFEPKARHPTAGSGDLSFLTDAPLQAWVDHFNSRNVAIEAGPVRRTGARAALMSLYVRDPDGNLVEVSEALHD